MESSQNFGEPVQITSSHELEIWELNDTRTKLFLVHSIGDNEKARRGKGERK